MRGTTTSLLGGAIAGALVGLGVWLYASRRLEARLEAGAAEISGSFAGGAARLNSEFDRRVADVRAEVIRQVRANVPAVVNESVMASLTRYGITPAMAQQLASTIAWARQHGYIS